jgi:hypothetical protein
MMRSAAATHANADEKDVSSREEFSTLRALLFFTFAKIVAASRPRFWIYCFGPFIVGLPQARQISLALEAGLSFCGDLLSFSGEPSNLCINDIFRLGNRPRQCKKNRL